MKPTIALFQHHPEASKQCCAGMIESLSPQFNIKVFSKDECNTKTISNIDMIAFPGGIGDSDAYYQFFKRKTANMIADYVSNGGRYLGICMGAYWAGSHYFDILEGIDAVQYIKRPDTSIKRSFGTVTPVIWNGKPQSMYFYDGCALVGDLSNTKVIATYQNGDAMAVIQNRIGLIGCHPESERSWYAKPYVEHKWHQGRHHKLLLEFANQLMLT